MGKKFHCMGFLVCFGLSAFVRIVSAVPSNLAKAGEVPSSRDALDSSPAQTAFAPSNSISPVSRWALSVGISIGKEALPRTNILSGFSNDPYGVRSGYVHPIEISNFSWYTLPVYADVTYSVAPLCQQNRNATCIDFLLVGLLEFQYLFYDAPVLSLGFHFGIESDVFFGSQSIVAWMSRFGVGYAYFSYNPIIEYPTAKHPGEVYYYSRAEEGGYDVADIIQHRLVFSLATGLLVNVPPAKGLSLYALFGISTTMSIPHFANYISLQAVFPSIGVRYRF